MANVKLRTIINADNSTTFQVQFADGTWADLTWDMISNKPFETLDNTVFIVDENGVLTITDSPINWSDIADKPFITLNPADFEVSASGVLSYKGSIDWADIIGKPFNTLNDNDFEIQNGQLSVKHQTIPNQNWSQIQQKPFNSLDPSTFQVVGGVLYLNTNPGITYWNDIENKPFSFIDNNTLEVVNDTLKAKAPTIPNQTWSQIENKPFSSLNPTDFSVNQSGEASVNFPQQTPDSWNSVTDKPFETIGSGLSVDPQTKALKAEGGSGTANWVDIQNKPFNEIGKGFYINEGVLNNMYFSYMKRAMPSKYITTLDTLKYFVSAVLNNAIKYKLGLSFTNEYFPLLLDGANNYMYLTLTIDNTKEGLTIFSDVYEVMFEAEVYQLTYSDTYDEFIITYRVNGMPLVAPDSSPKKYMIEGLRKYRANKTNGVYESVNPNGDSMATCSECSYFISSNGTIIQ